MDHHRRSDPRLTQPGRGAGERAALILALMISLICGAVVAGMLWSTGAKADRELAAHRHQVRATTTGPAKEPPVAAWYGSTSRAVAPAVWEQPEHVRRSGAVHVPPRTPQGRTVTIWVDDTGTPARPPGSAADRALTAGAGGGVATASVGAIGAGVLVLVRRRTEVRRLAVWEQEWEQVEPVWSGRLRRGKAPGTDDD
ncbi:Rv1733c family protein [Streptomyces vietnamensis]|uniref:Rv1733c family protein n=1 Tax=Streptomyces vietnamensis TaxID=362257 RepID=UPI00342827D3